MTNKGGPWGREEPEPRPGLKRIRVTGGGRFWIWFAVLAGVGGLVLVLAQAFPEAARTNNDWMNIAYAVGLLLLLSTRILRRPAAPGARHLRYAAIWVAIVAALVLAVAWRDELAGLPQRLRLAFSAGDPV